MFWRRLVMRMAARTWPRSLDSSTRSCAALQPAGRRWQGGMGSLRVWPQRKVVTLYWHILFRGCGGGVDVLVWFAVLEVAECDLVGIRCGKGKRRA